MGVGMLRLKDIWAMLERCAPGHRRVEKVHRWWIYYKQWKVTLMPTGKHGTRVNPEIQPSKLRYVVRLFEIEACATDFFPAVFPPRGPSEAEDLNDQVYEIVSGYAAQAGAMKPMRSS